MQAFHNDPAIKALYLKQLEAHAIADEIVQGQYWQNGKGCAVGCTIHGSQHSKYETVLGIPRTIAYLEDRIFEGLSNGEAKAFPLQFLTAIPVGADLSLVTAKFMLWLLDDPDQGVIRFATTDRTREAIQGVAVLYRKLLAGTPPTSEEWNQARSAAYAAADAYAYAADAACAAAYAAAYAAADAYAAAYAADAADAADADAAAYDARSNAYRAMRDQLLKLLSEATHLVPVTEPIQPHSTTERLHADK